MDIAQIVVNDPGSGRFLMHRSALTSTDVLDRERWNARINVIPYVREGTRRDTSYLARTNGGNQT